MRLSSALALLLGLVAVGFAHRAPAGEDLPFSVYFDADSDVLTRQTAATLDQVAKFYLQRGKGRELLMSGHADNGEVATYSDKDARCDALARNRIANVKVYLSGQGVPYDAITSGSIACTRPASRAPSAVRTGASN